MNDVAPAYVKLVLAVGQHDKDYVDAFYGPAEWKREADASKRPLPEIASEASALIARLEAMPEPADEMLRLRRAYLTRQLQALSTRVAMLGGKRLSFNDESRALYDAVAPVNTEEHFRVVRDELEVNGKSIMGVMMLAAECGSTLQLKAEGPDAKEALDALERLIESKFGES